MSKAKSVEEERIPREKEEQSHGRPDKKAYSVKSELPEDMRSPVDPGEHHMGGVVKRDSEHLEATHMGHAGMGHARRLLEEQTERGEHVAEVGGHYAHEHSGRHGHK